jgi:hypothetical protein
LPVSGNLGRPALGGKGMRGSGQRKGAGGWSASTRRERHGTTRFAVLAQRKKRRDIDRMIDESGGRRRRVRPKARQSDNSSKVTASPARTERPGELSPIRVVLHSIPWRVSSNGPAENPANFLRWSMLRSSLSGRTFWEEATCVHAIVVLCRFGSFCFAQFCGRRMRRRRRRWSAGPTWFKGLPAAATATRRGGPMGGPCPAWKWRDRQTSSTFRKCTSTRRTSRRTRKPASAAGRTSRSSPGRQAPGRHHARTLHAV